MVKQPIFPKFGFGALNAATAVNQIVTRDKSFKQVCLTNIGTQVIYIRIAPAADNTVASNADYPLLPNTQQVFSTTPEADEISFIAPSGVGSSLHNIDCEGY